MKNIGLILGSLLVSFSAHSQALNSKIHNQYNSFRAMGMGNAFTAVADDYSLLFYNPAGFGFKKSGEVQFSLVGVGLGIKFHNLQKILVTLKNRQRKSQIKLMRFLGS